MKTYPDRRVSLRTRYAAVVVALAVSVAALVAAIPATDLFTLTGVGALSGDWTSVATGFQRINDEACNGANSGVANAYATWSADTFDDDQSSSAILASIDSTGVLLLLVRSTGSGGTLNNYLMYLFPDNGNAYLGKINNGSFTQLDADAFIDSLTAGDEFELRVVGTTLTTYQNGTLLNTATDSDHSTGQPGMGSFKIGDCWDSWTGDNEAGGGGGSSTQRLTTLGVSQ